MHDGFDHAEALGRLRAAILSKWTDAEELTKHEITERFPKKKNIACAWELHDVMAEEPYNLIISVDINFPWSLPQVSLPKSVNGISYPHIELDGSMCLAPTSAPFDLPVDIRHVDQLVQDAIDLLAQGRTGENDQDYFTEAQSYWSLISSDVTELWLATRPPLSHAIWTSAIDSKNFVIASEKSNITNWAKAGDRKIDSIQPALLLKLPEPLHPRDYPLTMRDLVAIAKRIGAETELRKAISSWNAKSPLPVVLIFEYEESIILLGALFIPPGAIRLPGAKNNGIPGFRNGTRSNVSARIAALCQVADRFPHLKVVPIYKEFLLNRTAGITATSLETRHVLIAGCGALGGQLAVHLAQAGVGKLTLLDPETFDWRNVGRHVLDGCCVSLNKAIALADAIRRRFPDVSVEGIPKKWEAYHQENNKSSNSIDLLISTTGESTGNLHLDYLSASGDIAPVVFGWIEPFGVAAHAVFRHPSGGGLADITSTSGLPLDPVADIDTAPSLPKEPSCGAFYQPYSSMSALHGIALIGELALDVLFDRLPISTHRVWVGDSNEFQRNGLSITPLWHQRLNISGYCKRFDFFLPWTKG